MAMAGNSEAQRLLAEGIAALRRNDKAAARALLLHALEQDERNERAHHGIRVTQLF